MSEKTKTKPKKLVYKLV